MTSISRAGFAITGLIAGLAAGACGAPSGRPQDTAAASSARRSAPASDASASQAVAADSTIAPASRADTVHTSTASLRSAVLDALAAGDVAALAPLVHPQKGVRFSPYAHVDVTTDRVIQASDLAAEWTSDSARVWGSFDGSGEPIRLTFREYHSRFVFDHDFRQAPRVATDSAPMGTGNTINNVSRTYPGASVVEYHFPGFDPQYGGMDWSSLWLVFERAAGRWYLVGVVHGSWTI